MKKFLTSIFGKTEIKNQSINTHSPLSEFERAVLKSKSSNDFMPVWELFVNTPFFVKINQLDSGNTTGNFQFKVIQDSVTRNQPSVIISEVMERLESSSEVESAIKLNGSKLVEMLNPEVGILIALSDSGFGIPKEQVQWLKSCIQPIN